MQQGAVASRLSAVGCPGLPLCAEESGSAAAAAAEADQPGATGSCAVAVAAVIVTGEEDTAWRSEQAGDL